MEGNSLKSPIQNLIISFSLNGYCDAKLLHVSCSTTEVNSTKTLAELGLPVFPVINSGNSSTCISTLPFILWPILGLQPIPGDPKRQWHGGHIGWQNKTFCHPTWLSHHCLLDLQGLVANQELHVFAALLLKESNSSTTVFIYCSFGSSTQRQWSKLVIATFSRDDEEGFRPPGVQTMQFQDNRGFLV